MAPAPRPHAPGTGEGRGHGDPAASHCASAAGLSRVPSQETCAGGGGAPGPGAAERGPAHWTVGCQSRRGRCSGAERRGQDQVIGRHVANRAGGARLRVWTQQRGDHLIGRSTANRAGGAGLRVRGRSGEGPGEQLRPMASAAATQPNAGLWPKTPAAHVSLKLSAARASSPPRPLAEADTSRSSPGKPGGVVPCADPRPARAEPSGASA